MVEDYEKNLLALSIVFGVVGAEFVKNSSIGASEAILVGMIFALFASVVAAMFTEVLNSGAEEIQN